MHACRQALQQDEWLTILAMSVHMHDLKQGQQQADML